jgi:trehalose-phosphatase
MRYLFDHIAELEDHLDGKQVLLMLDFDGTLAPLAPTPEEAELPPGTREVLAGLSASPRCTLAVVSGRSLEDVRSKVGIDGITYVGNHGLEVELPGARPRSFAPPGFLSALDRMKASLAAAVAPYPGAFVEDKGFSIAVHYRTAAEEDRAGVKDAVLEVVRSLGDSGEVAVGAGSMVLELRPVYGCNKGSIVTSLLEAESLGRGEAGVTAIYVGDDATDEDAFKAIRGRGWGILVGAPRISYGGYYLKDPDEVRTLLERVLARCGRGR